MGERSARGGWKRYAQTLWNAAHIFGGLWEIAKRGQNKAELNDKRRRSGALEGPRRWGGTHPGLRTMQEAAEALESTGAAPFGFLRAPLDAVAALRGRAGQARWRAVRAPWMLWQRHAVPSGAFRRAESLAGARARRSSSLDALAASRGAFRCFQAP